MNERSFIVKSSQFPQGATAANICTSRKIKSGLPALIARMAS